MFDFKMISIHQKGRNWTLLDSEGWVESEEIAGKSNMYFNKSISESCSTPYQINLLLKHEQIQKVVILTVPPTPFHQFYYIELCN